MPNWTDVRVAVTHDDAFMIKQLQAIFDRGQPFNQIIPMPDDIMRDNITYEERKASDGKNWYDWSIQHWGTKWDAHQVSTELVDKNTLNIYMETAWSPPIPVFDRLILEYKYNIHAMYLDEGWNFIGEYIDGVEFTHDVSNAPDHLRDEFSEALLQEE